MAEATSRTRLALGEALVLQLRGLMTEARNLAFIVPTAPVSAAMMKKTATPATCVYASSTEDQAPAVRR